jgi:hypothetical protein
MTRLAGGQFRPVVQQAVAIHQYARQRHERIVALRRINGNGKFDGTGLPQLRFGQFEKPE